jgi:uncharacterized membrane protein YjdF
MTTTAFPLVEDCARPAKTTSDRTLFVLASLATAIFVVISLTARVPTYRINFIFLAAFIWTPVLLRRRLHLHAAHFALLIIAFLLHDVGAYGLYQKSPLPFSWDILVHYFFAIPVTLVLYRAIKLNFAAVLRPWQAGVVSLFFMMGTGALHEIMEYMSYLLLGEKHGMLKPATSYFFDTQRDLTNNLLGTLTALGLLAVARVVTLRRRAGADTVAVHKEAAP